MPSLRERRLSPGVRPRRLLRTVAVAQRGVVRRGYDDSGMPQNFIACDRGQELLLPPSLREWLPEDHLAWFVLAISEEMDLSAFYGAYRGDGHGRAAHEPAMMVALLLYAYCKGQRSSRVIERECVEDVAFRAGPPFLDLPGKCGRVAQAGSLGGVRRGGGKVGRGKADQVGGDEVCEPGG
jgi:Transposase domain (DUF772)